MSKPMHEYAFDVKMKVVMRVKAKSLKEARKLVGLEAEDLNVQIEDVHITEGSTDEILGTFEIDGKPVDYRGRAIDG